jgi:hypothetical protein
MAPAIASAPAVLSAAGPSGATVTISVHGPMQAQAQPPVIEQSPQTQAGALTAASVGDVDRRDNYLGYLSRHAIERETFALDMTRRMRVRVLDAQQRPVNDARITVTGQGVRVAGRTHADGTWDFFPGVSAPQAAGRVVLHVQAGDAGTEMLAELPAQGDAQDVVVALPTAVATPPRVLDLGFLIDVTGSMGDELRYVNREVADIVRRIEAATPGIVVRVGATFYRDRGDRDPLQQIPFTTRVAGFVSEMHGIEASGGGDYPEDLDSGLEAAMNRLAWSEGNAVRVLVLIADAPPQHYRDAQYRHPHALVDAARRGIRFLPVAASGADRNVEYLFRAMGAFTSTPYVYLTDDSGIGEAHMEADTDRVAIERFNDLLVRLVLSDLRGLGMHEPGV